MGFSRKSKDMDQMLGLMDDMVKDMLFDKFKDIMGEHEKFQKILVYMLSKAPNYRYELSKEDMLESIERVAKEGYVALEVKGNGDSLVLQLARKEDLN
jgi:hypothetical protein